MLLLSIYVLYFNVTYIYPVSCLVEIKLLCLKKNYFKLFQIESVHVHSKFVKDIVLTRSNVSDITQEWHSKLIV